MAEKKEVIANIPLRASWVKEPRNDRTKRTILTIKEYVFRHMKSEDVKVSKLVNELIWERGIQKPPGSIKVKISVSDGVAKVMLPDEKEEVKVEKKGAAESLKDRITGKKEEPKAEAAKEGKPEHAKEHAHPEHEHKHADEKKK